MVSLRSGARLALRKGWIKRNTWLKHTLPSSLHRAPWSAELQPNYYVVRDADGQQIAYINYSNDPDRRSAAKLARELRGGPLSGARSSP